MAQKKKPTPVAPAVDEVEVVDEDLTVDEVIPAIVHPVTDVRLIVANEGENWQSIAAANLPDGWSRNDYAEALYEANGKRNVVPGALVKLV